MINSKSKLLFLFMIEFSFMQFKNSKRINILLVHKTHKWFCCNFGRRSSDFDSKL